MRIGKLATTKQNPFGIKWGAPKTPPPVPPKDAQPAAPAARQASAPARPATGEGPSALASRAPEKALPPLPEATAPHYASSTAPWVNDTATIRPGEAGGHALNRGFGQLLEGSAPMDHAAPAAAPRHEASPARNESSADRGSLHPDDFAAIRGFWNRADAHVEGLMNRINPAGDGLRTPEQLRQFNRELPGALPAHLNNHLYDQGIRSAGRPPIPAEWMPPDWKDRAASVPSGSAPAVPHAGTSASAPAAAEAGPSTSGAPVGEHRREPSPTPSEKAEARENPGTLSPEEKRAFWRQQRKEWSEANMKGGDARGGGRW